MTKLIGLILTILMCVLICASSFAQQLCREALNPISSDLTPRKVILTYLSARAAGSGLNKTPTGKTFSITQNYVQYSALHNDEALGILVDLMFDKNMDLEIQRQALIEIASNNDIFRDQAYLNLSDANKQKIMIIASKKVTKLVDSYKSGQPADKTALQYEALSRWALLSYKTNPESLDDIMDVVMIEINENVHAYYGYLERFEVLFKAFVNFIEFAHFKPDSRFWQKDIRIVINKMSQAFNNERFEPYDNKIVLVQFCTFILRAINKSPSSTELGMIKNQSSLLPVMMDLFKIADKSLDELEKITESSQNPLYRLNINYVITPSKQTIQHLKQVLGLEPPSRPGQG